MNALLLSLLLSSAPLSTESTELSLHVPHSFALSDARYRMELLFDYWRTRFGMKAEWHGDEAYVEGSTMGVDFRARLVLKPDSVDAQLSDPGYWVRSRAVSYVHNKLLKYLHPTYQEP